MKGRILVLTLLLLLVTAGAAQAMALYPALSVEGPQYAQRGTEFVVNVNLSDAVSIQAVETQLQFDPAKLEVVPVQEGQYFQPSSLLSQALVLYPEGGLKNGDIVTMAAGWTTLNGISFTGQKSLGSVRFRVLQDGMVDLNLVYTELVNSDSQNVVHQVVNTSVVLDGTPPQIVLGAPLADAYLNNQLPTVAASVYETGSGLDFNNIVFKLDGNPIDQYTFANSVLQKSLTQPLADGVHQAEVTVQDLAGNTSTLSWKFTVDTIPPAPAQITGGNSIINSINQNAVQLSGQTEADGTVIFVFSDQLGQSVTASTTADSSGQFTCTTDLSELSDGQINYQVVVRDNAGNESSPFTGTITKDTVIAQPQVNLPGVIIGGQTIIKVNGTGEPLSALGLTFTDSTGKQVVAEATLDETGLFNTPVDITGLQDGVIQVSCVLYDVAGNQSLPLTLTTMKDTVMRIDTARHSAKRALIIGDKLTITAFAEPGAQIQYSFNGLNGELSELSPGYYQAVLEITANMPSVQDQPIILQCTDPVGNYAEVTLPPVTVITVLPEINAVTHNYQAAYKAGDRILVSVDGTPGLSGIISIGSLVSEGSLQEDPINPGHYTYEYIVGQGDMAYDALITVTLEDAAGNRVSMNDFLLVTVDTEVPYVSTIVTPGLPDGENDYYVTPPTILLVSEPGATIYLTVNGEPVADYTSPLPYTPPGDGEYFLTAWAVDAAGNQGLSSKLYFKVKSEPPAEPVIYLPVDNNNDPINYTNDPNFQLTVQAEPGTSVRLYQQGVEVGQGTDLSGFYTFDVQLVEGWNDFTVVSTDQAGNENYAWDFVELDTIGPRFAIEAGEPDAANNVQVSITPSEYVENGLVTVGDAPDAVTVGLETLAYDFVTGTYTGSFQVNDSSTLHITVTGQDVLGNQGNSELVRTLVTADQETALGDGISIYIPLDVFNVSLSSSVNQISAMSSPATESSLLKSSSRYSVLGTTASATQITVSPTDEGVEIAETAGLTPVKVVKFSPVLTFNSDVYLTLSYDPAFDISKLDPYYFDAGNLQWVNLHDQIVSIDEVNHQIKFATRQLGVFGIFADIMPPEYLYLDLPSARLQTEQTTVSISGETYSSYNIIAFVNGQQVSTVTADDDGYFTLDAVPLNVNMVNEVKIVVEDQYHNQIMQTVEITQDSLAPALELTAPSDGFETKEGVLTVTGTAEPGAVVRVEDNYGNVLDLGNQGTFSGTIQLTEGINEHCFTAVDFVGNVTTQHIHVIRNSTPPYLQVFSPKHEMTTAVSPLVAEGITEPGCRLVISNNGVVAVDTTLTTDNFAEAVQLQQGELGKPGVNVITVQVTDKVGNITTQKLTIYYDVSSPPIVLTSPSSALPETNYRHLELAGTTRPGAIVTMTVTNSAGTTGVQLTNQDGSFSNNLTLAPGSNVITITSTDSQGSSDYVLEVNYIEAGGFLRGYAVRKDSAKLAGVDVTYNELGYEFGSTTNAQGYYELQLDPGTVYYLVATKDGYLPGDAVVDNIEMGEITLQDFNLTFGNFVDNAYEPYQIIDIFDVMKMINMYGVTSAEPRWDSTYNYNTDGIIDIFDVMAAVSNYGQQYIPSN